MGFVDLFALVLHWYGGSKTVTAPTVIRRGPSATDTTIYRGPSEDDTVVRSGPSSISDTIRRGPSE